MVFELFDRKGTKFTLDELAKSMRISKRTIYSEYSSKEDLLEAVVRSVFESIRRREAEILANPELNILEKAKEVICIFPAQKINFGRLDELRVTYPRIYGLIHQEFEANWEHTFSILQRAVDEGYLKPVSFENLRIILLGLFTELLSCDASIQRVKLRECLDIILEGYICSPR